MALEQQAVSVEMAGSYSPSFTRNARSECVAPITTEAGKNIKRYSGRVKTSNGKLSGEYVDWFNDDNDARATYRVIMEQQGYKVKSVTVDNQTAIVEVE